MSMSGRGEEHLLEKRKDLGMLELAREHLVSENTSGSVVRPSKSAISHEYNGMSFSELLGNTVSEIDQMISDARREFNALADGLEPDYNDMNENGAANIRLALKEREGNTELPEGVRKIVDGETDLRTKWRKAEGIKDVEEEFAEMIYALRDFSSHNYGEIVGIWEPNLSYEEVDRAINEIKEDTISILKEIDEERINEVWNETGANVDEDVTLQQVTDSPARIHEFMANYVLGGNPVKMPVRIAESGMEYGNSAMAPLQTTAQAFWAKSLDTTAHEFGHTFGRENLSEENMFLPLGEPPSEAIDEGSARFYQNHVFRSKSFQEHLSDEPRVWLKAHGIPDFDPEQLHGWFNAVNPENTQRISADPLTYPLHVAIRYELEKELIESERPVEEMLPELHSRWQERMQEYIGDNIGVTYDLDERDTVLQDVHWGKGKLGYFPSYTLGDVMAAGWKESMEQDLEKPLEEYVRDAELGPVNDWMVENIWQHGRAVWERSEYTEPDVDAYKQNLCEIADQLYH